MSKKRRKYSPEFKDEVVRLVVDGQQSAAQVGRDLGLSPHLVSKWVSLFEARGGKNGLTVEERSELERLRKENARLRMERDILKKATVFFAKIQSEDTD